MGWSVGTLNQPRYLCRTNARSNGKTDHTGVPPSTYGQGTKSQIPKIAAAICLLSDFRNSRFSSMYIANKGKATMQTTRVSSLTNGSNSINPPNERKKGRALLLLSRSLAVAIQPTPSTDHKIYSKW